MAEVFAIFTSIFIFVKFSPVLSAAVIVLIQWRAIKSSFLFFIFLTLVGLGLFSLVENLSFFALYVHAMLGGAVDLGSIERFFLGTPVSVTLSIILQIKLVKHWKVYEENNVSVSI
ncbi:hypothetical protein FLM48_12105 [Shewanella sp. Scap07]|uniref:hypothetical protein n=1 Tax=Shewanella sp. Scap07 TaxID=2589987 RepID=UPI0015BF7650|nr:hypothetical protein [Shewanella sp. Scap07]QLE85745.1 hypothetical protein FLM48_12105 [Shewanella sp. Scap07]